MVTVVFAEDKKEGQDASKGTSGGGHEVPTFDQFEKAVKAYEASGNGATESPKKEQYDAYVTAMKEKKLSLAEQAQFCANIFWETAGLKHKEELDENCRAEKCPYKKFYGRGYIQLSWEDNYRAASEAILGDGQILVDHPERVLDEDLAWKTAVWYWMEKVHPKLEAAKAVDQNQLGHSVMAINGALECGPNENGKADEHGKAGKRLKIYKAIIKEWGLPSTPEPTLAGCVEAVA